MSTILMPVYVIICLAVGFLLCGVLLGAVFAVVLSERAQARMARYQRTGNVSAPPKETVTAMPGGEFQGLSESAQAQQRAYKAVIERGADDFMERNPGIDREEARRRARQAIDELGAFKTGGL